MPNDKTQTVLIKWSLAIFAIVLIVSMMVIKPDSDYFEHFGNLVKIKSEHDESPNSQQSLDLEKMRPKFNAR